MKLQLLQRLEREEPTLRRLSEPKDRSVECAMWEAAGIQVVRVPRAKLAGPGLCYRYHLVIDGVRRRDFPHWHTCKALAERISRRRTADHERRQIPTHLG